MQFDSVSEILQMGGHGKYVWSAYFIALVTIVYLVWTPLIKHKQFFVEQRGRLRREQAQAERQSKEN